MRTKLQGGTVLGYNGQSHVLIRDGVVMWEDDWIIYVGRDNSQGADRTLHAADRLIIPGLINLHWHGGVRANWRLTSDHGDLQFFGAGFPNTDAGSRGVSYAVSEAESDVAATLNEMGTLHEMTKVVNSWLQHLRGVAGSAGILPAPKAGGTPAFPAKADWPIALCLATNCQLRYETSP